MEHPKNKFAVTVEKDSVPTGLPEARLTSILATYPRFIHSEFMTHRVFSRNSASSRALPVEKLLEQVKNHPVIPVHWGAAQKGMQAYSELSFTSKAYCEDEWLNARDMAVKTVENMLHANLHKQIANRLLEPWMWITVLYSGTQWSNFFALRCHEAAEPHMQKIAYMIREEYNLSVPSEKSEGEWHMPFEVLGEHLHNNIRIAVGRCARLSYMTFDGRYSTEEDIALHDRLASSGHWSPFEHVACVRFSKQHPHSNFHPVWCQYRKGFLGECK